MTDERPPGQAPYRWQARGRFRVRGTWLHVHARLRPRAGRRLPTELRAEHVAHLAEALPQGVRDAGFEPLVGRIDTGPIHYGNHVQLFFHGEEALASVGQAIEGATQEILLETYILRDDATGRKLVRLLGGAAARGVKVRVLADAYGSWNTKQAFWREMQDLKIEARLFCPFWSQLRGFLFRDHRKIIAIDRRVSFVGGMNVANEYGSSRSNKDAPWRDTHMRVEGPTAWELALVFNEGWERSGGTSLHLPSLAPSNLDFRSFYFNAECNVVVFDDAIGQTMAQMFEEDLGNSREIGWETWNQRPLAHRLGDALARCFSPLL